MIDSMTTWGRVGDAVADSLTWLLRLAICAAWASTAGTAACSRINAGRTIPASAATTRASPSPVPVSSVAPGLRGLTVSQSATFYPYRLTDAGPDISQFALAIQAQGGSANALSAELDYQEPGFDIGLRPAERRARLPPDVVDLLPIEANCFPATTIVAVSATRNAIQVRDDLAETNISMALPFPLRRGLRALMTWDPSRRQADLTMFAVVSGSGSPELAIGRIRNVVPLDPHRRAPELDLAMRSIEPLGAGWVGADVALGSFAAGSPKVVASVANDRRGAVLTIVAIAGEYSEARVGQRLVVHVPGQVALGPVAVTHNVQLRRSSHIDAAFVARDAGDQPNLRLVTVAIDDIASFDLAGEPILSPPLKVPGTAREILIAYGRTRDPRRPRVLIRATEGSTYLYRPDGDLRKTAVLLATGDEAALLGVDRSWFAIINDRAGIRREKIESIPPETWDD